MYADSAIKAMRKFKITIVSTSAKCVLTEIVSNAPIV